MKDWELRLECLKMVGELGSSKQKVGEAAELYEFVTAFGEHKLDGSVDIAPKAVTPLFS